ncbi:MAG TPA: YciI family protein [Polyangiales bacterium]|jgi:hypothetical protein|nr:YciI family protein [Polyangiales bacterium]
MLFMVMHKVDAKMEAGGKPDPRIISGMQKLVGEALQEGRFRNGAGLKRSAERVRLRFKAGKREVTRGPYQGDNELLAGFAMLKVQDMDEAIAWSTRIAEVEGGDVEFEIGPVVEAWDLGIAPKPMGDFPLRVLTLRKGDKHSEAGATPPPAMMAKMEKLIGEMKEAGVLLALEGLKPSKTGARLDAKGGKHVWTDGPFLESRELVAGFSIIDMDTLADAKKWTERYADILGDTQVDVREVAG